MAIRSQIRESNRGTPEMPSRINEVKKDLENQINILKNQPKSIVKHSTSLYYNNVNINAGAAVSIGGTDSPGATNIFTSTVIPVHHTTDLSNDWLTNTINTNNPLYGILKYKGPTNKTFIIDITYAATTPASGGDPLRGYDLNIQLFVNNVPVHTADGELVEVKMDCQFLYHAILLQVFIQVVQPIP